MEGVITDLGDAVLVQQLLIKGRHRAFAFHVGAPADTTPADRVVRGVAHPSTGRTDLIVDLRADKQAPLSLVWKDEVGNITSAPDSAVVAYTGDNPEVLVVNDNGDGTAQVVATGVLGTANVHVEADWDGGHRTGDVQFVVVPGDAERIEIAVGEPTEVTPDE